MPEISVIIPIYNAGLYLNKCIESLISQTFGDFELLLVNDGSNDGSGIICDEYAARDQRIRVFHQPNSGVTAARKNGWKNAQGNWIAFVDADDTAHQNLLEVLINQARQYDCDIVNVSFQSVPGGRKWIHKKLGLMNHKEYLESFLYNQTYGVVYASIYKKSIVAESTFSFDPSLKIGEDVLMNIDLALRSRSAVNIPDILYDYTDNENSVMNRKIRHPLYFERYYQTKKNLFNGEKIVRNQDKILEREKFLFQLDAFYSPNVKYEKSIFLELKKFEKENPSMHGLSLFHLVKIYSIKTKTTFLITKLLSNLFQNIKMLLCGNQVKPKEVIY